MRPLHNRHTSITRSFHAGFMAYTRPFHDHLTTVSLTPTRDSTDSQPLLDRFTPVLQRFQYRFPTVAHPTNGHTSVTLPIHDRFTPVIHALHMRYTCVTHPLHGDLAERPLHTRSASIARTLHGQFMTATHTLEFRLNAHSLPVSRPLHTPYKNRCTSVSRPL